MSRTVYALLVGINDYGGVVPSLKGCLRDVEQMQGYLEDRVADGAFDLQLQVLLQDEATRDEVTNRFEQHLGQAGANDVALFYFCGHGAQALAPEEFWPMEPDHMNETLVCVDSRHDGQWDLSDKELAVMIRDVAARDPHVAVILDCCHSGSGTRALVPAEAVRQCAPDMRPRPFASFPAAAQTLPDSAANVTRSLQAGSGWVKGAGKHVLMAACLDAQVAREYSGAGPTQGGFSHFMMNTLQAASRPLTYYELFARTRLMVEANIANQSPQLEAAGGARLDEEFLGGAIRETTAQFLINHRTDAGWYLSAGRVHGIPEPQGEATASVAVYASDAEEAELEDPEQAITTARVTRVEPLRSRLGLQAEAALSTSQNYAARLIDLPLGKMPVVLDGDPQGRELLAEQLQASPTVRRASSPEDARFRVLAVGGFYVITRPADDQPLVAEVEDYTPQSAAVVARRLEHIGRWTTTVELNNPATRLPSHCVKMDVLVNGETVVDSDVVLTYRQENGQWIPPTFTLRLKSRWPRDLHCAVVDLTQRYSIFSGLFPEGCVRLGPRQEIWVLNGDPIPATIPESYLERGITQYTDILKLIVSTESFDARALDQPGLDLPYHPVATRSVSPSRLDRLLTRVNSRDLGSQGANAAGGDWRTSERRFSTVKPPDKRPLRTDEPTALQAGVEIGPHPELQAEARLISRDRANVEMGTALIPPILRNAQSPSLEFAASRGMESGLLAVELSELNDARLVTAEKPLNLVLPGAIEPSEPMLAVGYDFADELFLPLGIYDPVHRRMRLDRLPTPAPDGGRSLGGSIKILLQKLVAPVLPGSYSYPRLAIARVAEDREVSYDADLAELRRAVAGANRILLLVHGMFGDTREMVQRMSECELSVNGQRTKARDQYDLILSFDYESLNTPVEETARALKDRLIAAGLGSDHGKTIHLVGHSLGGLIARWFVEGEGGHRWVQGVLLTGTPSGGTPWSTVQDLALSGITLAINGLTTIAWPLQLLGQLVGQLESLDVTLDQLAAESELLQKLAASADPKLPYAVVAGQTSLASHALASRGTSGTLFERLRRRIGGRPWLHGITAPVFLGQANDIAATVASLTALPTGWTPDIDVYRVACDHMSYYREDAGLSAIAQALSKWQ